MKSQKILSFFTLITSLMSCFSNSQKTSLQKDTNHFRNVIKVEMFGDTSRLEIEKKGDTLIKHFIDLKGKKDDNFDDSYTAVCTYERRSLDSTILTKNKKEKIISILTENYTTEFSGGKNIYYITYANDTIFKEHILEGIK